MGRFALWQREGGVEALKRLEYLCNEPARAAGRTHTPHRANLRLNQAFLDNRAIFDAKYVPQASDS